MSDPKQVYVIMKWGYQIDSVFDDYDKALDHAYELRRCSYKIAVYPVVLNRPGTPRAKVEL